MSRRPAKTVAFQRLTCIQQTGTRRETNGTICYTFVAEINRNLPPVQLTLTVSPTLVLSVDAIFNEHARRELGENHPQEEEQTMQPALLDAS